MTSSLRWKGRYVLDGGVVDNVPVCALDDAPGATLVLLTRRYRALPDIPGRTYVQPSRRSPWTPGITRARRGSSPRTTWDGGTARSS